MSLILLNRWLYIQALQFSPILKYTSCVFEDCWLITANVPYWAIRWNYKVWVRSCTQNECGVVTYPAIYASFPLLLPAPYVWRRRWCDIFSVKSSLSWMLLLYILRKVSLLCGTDLSTFKDHFHSPPGRKPLSGRFKVRILVGYIWCTTFYKW